MKIKRHVGRHRRKGYTYTNKHGNLVTVAAYHAGSGPTQVEVKGVRSTKSGFFNQGGPSKRSNGRNRQRPCNKRQGSSLHSQNPRQQGFVNEEMRDDTEEH